MKNNDKNLKKSILAQMQAYWMNSRPWTCTYGCLFMTVMTILGAVSLHGERGFLAGMLFGIDVVGSFLWFCNFIAALYNLYDCGYVDGSNVIRELNKKHLSILSEELKIVLDQPAPVNEPPTRKSN